MHSSSNQFRIALCFQGEQVCRLGGDPNPGRCRGPCDMKAVEGRFANFDGPSNPAARYRRGQKVKIKYQRNNHGPGGFVRHSVVPVHQMMNKAVHTRNAFHYSCFGARPERATASDRRSDRWGYSISGNDGKKVAPGYYVTAITIPDVVPDGDYVFGWVWFGGTGGDVSNNWPYNKEPWWKGYFSDYWSCSFVRIEGGNPLKSSYTPVFQNDMSKFSEEGCMSANNAPGICIREPCFVKGKYQKPRQFKNGTVPDPITPANFASSSINDQEGTVDPPSAQLPPGYEDPGEPKNDRKSKRPESDEPARNHQFILQKRACRCIGLGTKCGKRVARRTGGHCKSRTLSIDQPRQCIRACCDVCKLNAKQKQTRRLCSDRDVWAICRI